MNIYIYIHMHILYIHVLYAPSDLNWGRCGDEFYCLLHIYTYIYVYIYICTYIFAVYAPSELEGGCGDEDYRANSLECGTPAKNPVQVLYTHIYIYT